MSVFFIRATVHTSSESKIKVLHQRFYAWLWQMVKHTLENLRCSHRKIFKICLGIFHHYAWKGWQAFFQALKTRKNSILNWVMKLSLFLCFFSYLFLKHPWKIFHSISVFFLLFGLDITSTLKGNLFLRINSKFPRKVREKCSF